MLIDEKCAAHAKNKTTLGRPLPPAPIGACMLPIAEGYAAMIRPGMRVLEIGCGSWDLIKARCEEVGAHYESIDVQMEYYGRAVVATRLENLASLSFPDDAFDLVIGSQSMEHWAEFGCPTVWGLHQCFRVCRREGRVLLNVPFCFHGTKPFLTGDRARLHRLFARFSDDVEIIEWGRPSAPLPDFITYPDYAPLSGRPASIIDIQAVKSRPLPRPPVLRVWPRGRLGQLLNYPLSFNAYRVRRRVGSKLAGVVEARRRDRTLPSA
jgi:SAM-dependent methyltransferase